TNRSTRCAGPLTAGLTYLRARGPTGIAWLALRGGAITLTSLLAEHRLLAPSLGFVLLLLVFVGPRAYRLAFPHSRIELVHRPRSAGVARTEQTGPARPDVPRELDALALPREQRA